ncbi:MAG TPA: class I SAM-dependent methyltransferase [Candidatus Binataceae bacterium]|nr:class I SAM-dependent methyltransferase [Candidatus Binataceae bacterium]
MNRQRRTVWEDRHRGASQPGEPEPSVVEMLPLLGRGLALDVAAGTGRNSVALARAGIRVVAADFSVNAMRILAAEARREGLPIMPVVADLEESFPFRAQSFDTVVNVSFLSRAIVPYLKEALRVGGVLLFDAFLIDQAETGHPRDPAFLLMHYELREMLAGMELLRYREGMVAYPGDKSAWRAVALARRTS